MKKALRMLCLLLPLAVSSCELEDEDDLPKPTQTGENMMVAKVNGELWVMELSTGSFWNGGSGLYLYYDDGDLSLSGLGQEHLLDASVGIRVQNMRGTGTYKLGKPVPRPVYGSDGNYGYVDDFRPEGVDGNSYTTSEVNTGIVIITRFDPKEKIISGTFSFRAENECDPLKYMQVTDGRFDVTYR